MTEQEAEEGNRATVPQFGVWPDNIGSVNVFTAMSTQWQVGGTGGVVGLVYTSIEPTLRLLQVPRKEWSEVFADIRVLEDAAMEQIRMNK